MYKLKNRWWKVLTYYFILRLGYNAFKHLTNHLLDPRDPCLINLILWDTDNCSQSPTVMMLHKLLKAQHHSRQYIGEDNLYTLIDNYLIDNWNDYYSYIYMMYKICTVGFFE